MHSSLLLLASALAVASAQSTPTSTTSLNRTPEGTPIPLSDTINALCQPTFFIWDRGTLDQKRAWGLDQYDREEVELGLGESSFPCERAKYWQTFCLPSIYIRRNSMGEPYDAEDETGKGSKEQIVKERECYCESEAWDYMTGCLNCQAVHGYGSASPYIAKEREQMDWIKQKFCNETVPERNYYHLVNSNEVFEMWGSGGDDGYRSGELGEEDEVGGSTEVSLYWTASVSRTGSIVATASGTGSETRASATAVSTVDGEVTEIRGTVTRTSSGVNTVVTETQGSAVSSAAGAASSAPAAGAGASEVKVGGGLVMAVLGAMALL